mmetsp:Transcript_24861/g.74813  ORF Transcript_24861/g.74813 Transcript_24861/m.74813 type:complete len:371 (-) Transcript_24861:22-1134(-)
MIGSRVGRSMGCDVWVAQMPQNALAGIGKHGAPHSRVFKVQHTRDQKEQVTCHIDRLIVIRFPGFLEPSVALWPYIRVSRRVPHAILRDMVGIVANAKDPSHRLALKRRQSTRGEEAAVDQASRRLGWCVEDCLSRALKCSSSTIDIHPSVCNVQESIVEKSALHGSRRCYPKRRAVGAERHCRSQCANIDHGQSIGLCWILHYSPCILSGTQFVTAAEWHAPMTLVGYGLRTLRTLHVHDRGTRRQGCHCPHFQPPFSHLWCHCSRSVAAASIHLARIMPCLSPTPSAVVGRRCKRHRLVMPPSPAGSNNLMRGTPSPLVRLGVASTGIRVGYRSSRSGGASNASNTSINDAATRRSALSQTNDPVGLR